MTLLETPLATPLAPPVLRLPLTFPALLNPATFLFPPTAITEFPAPLATPLAKPVFKLPLALPTPKLLVEAALALGPKVLL